MGRSRNRPHLVLVATVAAGLACFACTTTAYKLKIDAKSPANIELCTAQARGAEDCEIYDAQPLDAPARLSVQITNTEVEQPYRLAIEQQQIAARGTDARRILGDVVGRLVGLGTSFTKMLTPSPKDGGDPAKEEFDAKEGLLAKVKSEVAELKPQLSDWIEGHADRLLGQPPQPIQRQAPEQLFRGWIDLTTPTPTFKAHFATDGDTLFDESIQQLPPARVATLTNDDLQYLARQNVTIAELGKHVREKCEPASFGKYAPLDKPWIDAIPALALNDSDLVKALALDKDRIIASARSGAPRFDISARILELKKEAYAAIRVPARPAREAEVAYVTQLLAYLRVLTSHCTDNLALLHGLDPGGGYESVRVRLDSLTALTKSASRSFREMIQPFLMSIVREVIQTRSTGGDVAFGSRSIQAGKILVAVTEGQDDTQRELVNLTLNAKGYDGLAIFMGGVVAGCGGCYAKVDESIVPGEGGAMARRVLREVSDDLRVGAFAAVHVSVLRAGYAHHFGILAGYPIAGSEDPTQVLLGLSYRHTGGLGIGMGAHLFQNQVMKEDIGNEVDLGAPGNVALDASSVSSPEIGIAPFLSLGVSTDLMTN